MLGGCLSDSSEYPEIGEITVLNTRDQQIEVSVTVTKAVETVYDRTHELNERRESEVDAISIVEPWMGTSEDIEVTVSTPGGTSETFSTAEFAERYSDYESCLPLTVFVRPEYIEMFYGMGGCSEV